MFVDRVILTDVCDPCIKEEQAGSLEHRVYYLCETKERKLIELHSLEDGKGLILQIYLGSSKLLQIHTNSIVIKNYNGYKREPFISHYEVLWAAGVLMEDETLQPVINEHYETSKKGVFVVGSRWCIENEI